MAKVLLLLFGIMAFQRCIKAAPSKPNVNIHAVIAGSIEGEAKLDNEPNYIKHATNDNDDTQSQRQRRFYDFTGFEYSPYDLPPAFSYPSQPNNKKRDSAHNIAVYGTEDPLNLIFKRLQEVVRDVRYQNVPSYAQIPAYIPFLYIPQFDCGCTSNNQGPAPPVNNPTPQPPVSPASSEPGNGIETTTNSSVTLDNRGGFDDRRQNWGVVTSKPDSNDDVIADDGSRPISFDPIPPEEPLDIPVPPVDHGTVQAGAESSQNRNQINPSKEQNIPAPSYLPGRPEETPASSSKNIVPSLCDGAIISCCNRPQITDKCFEALGCQDPYVYGNPCDPKIQLMVINKFQHFQKRRTG